MALSIGSRFTCYNNLQNRRIFLTFSAWWLSAKTLMRCKFFAGGQPIRPAASFPAPVFVGLPGAISRYFEHTQAAEAVGLVTPALVSDCMICPHCPPAPAGTWNLHGKPAQVNDSSRRTSRSCLWLLLFIAWSKATNHGAAPSSD